VLFFGTDGEMIVDVHDASLAKVQEGLPSRSSVTRDLTGGAGIDSRA
jgi:hypothetical protein